MFRSNTAPVGTSAADSTTPSSSSSPPSLSFLAQLQQTILAHPTTLLTGEEGCGKTSVMCHLEKKLSTASSTSNANTSTILHLCGTTLDSIHPKKIARRLTVELCRILLSCGTTTDIFEKNSSSNNNNNNNNNANYRTSSTEDVETLLSAANTAPDEHLAEVTLQALETFVHIQQIIKKSSSSSSSSYSPLACRRPTNLIIFVDGIDKMFVPSSSSSSTSPPLLCDSPILNLLDLLPLHSENLYPHIRFVFSFRRTYNPVAPSPSPSPSPSSSSSSSALQSASEYHRLVISKLFERLSGGFDCLSSSVSSSEIDHHRSLAAPNAKACIVAFPLSLTKSSAEKIINSQLGVLGKRWPRNLMEKAISNLPSTATQHSGLFVSSLSSCNGHNSSGLILQQSLSYNFFASRDSERNRYYSVSARKQRMEKETEFMKKRKREGRRLINSVAVAVAGGGGGGGGFLDTQQQQKSTAAADDDDDDDYVAGPSVGCCSSSESDAENSDLVSGRFDENQDDEDAQAQEERDDLFRFFLSSHQTMSLPPQSVHEATMLKCLFSLRNIMTTMSAQQNGQSPSSFSELGRFASPRFISVFIKELAATASFETLEQTFNDIYSTCPTTNDLVAFIINRVSATFGKEEVLSVISCVLNTEIGVSEHEISLVTGVPPRTVVAVLGSSGLRDFVIDRAGVLKGDECLRRIFTGRGFATSADEAKTTLLTTKTKNGCIQLFLYLLETQPEESIGRVCRELPLLFIALRRYKDLARFLSRHDVMHEMFVASKKAEFLGLWKLALANDATISIDDKTWLFPVYAVDGEGDDHDDDDDIVGGSEPKKLSASSPVAVTDASSHVLFQHSFFATTRSSSSSSFASANQITSSDHHEFYRVDTIRPIHDNVRIESIILLSRLWGTFGKTSSAVKMLKRTIRAITESAAADDANYNYNVSSSSSCCDASEEQLVFHSTKTQLLQRLAQALVSEGKFSQAVQIVREALAIAPSEQVPGLLKVLGRGFRKLGDYTQALECFDKALKSISAMTAKSEERPMMLVGGSTSTSLSSFSPSSSASASPSSSSSKKVIYSKDALRTESTSKYFQKMDFDVASCLDEKGDVLRKLDRNTEALTILKKSLALKHAALSLKHPAIASTLYSIAAAEKSQGNALRAFSTVSEGIAIVENFYGPESAKLFDFRFLQANCAVILDHLPLALSLYQDLLTFCQSHFGPEKMETAETMQQIAQVYKKLGRVNSAWEYLPEAYRLLKTIFAKEGKFQHPKLVKILIQLADLERKIGRHHESLLYAEEAVTMAKQLWEQEEAEKKERKISDELDQINQKQQHQQQQQQQRGQQGQQQQEREQQPDPCSPKIVADPKYDVTTAEAITSLACARMKQASTDDEFEDIGKLCRAALEICEFRLGPIHTTTAACLVALGDAQRKTANQLLNALESYQRALDVYEAAYGKFHVEVTDTLYKIGRCQKKLHWYARAQRSYEEAIQRMVRGAEQRQGRDGSNCSGNDTGNGGSTSSSSTSNSNNRNVAALNSLMMLQSRRRRGVAGAASKKTSTRSRASVTKGRAWPTRENTNGKNNDDNVEVGAGRRVVDAVDDADDDVMNHPKMAILQQSLGDCFRKQLEVEKARRLYEQALATNHLHYGEKHEEVAECENGLAMCLFLDGRLAEALELETKVVAMTIELLGHSNRHSKNRERNLKMIKDQIETLPLQ